MEMDTPADNQHPQQEPQEQPLQEQPLQEQSLQEQSLQETTSQEQPPQKQTCGSEKQDDSDSYSSDSCTSYSSDSCSGSDSDSCSEGEEVGDESNDGESTMTNRPTSLSRDTSPRAPTRSSGSQHRNVFQRLSSSDKPNKVANVNVSPTKSGNVNEIQIEKLQYSLTLGHIHSGSASVAERQETSHSDIQISFQTKSSNQKVPREKLWKSHTQTQPVLCCTHVYLPRLF